MEIKNVAIIGAGWTGLQVAKVLMDCGYKVTVFEELADVGGTWNPALAYHELSIHTPISLCEFYDFKFPDTHNRKKKLYFKDIWEYCRLFAKSNNLYKVMHFNTKVTKLNYLSEQQKCIVTTQDQEQNVKDTEFDFVISTFFNSPRLPKFKGQEHFKGKIYHSNDIKEDLFTQICKSNAKVALLGGNKSATDVALVFIRHNYRFKWILRDMYWFLSYDKVFWDLRKNKPASLINKVIYFIFRITTATFKDSHFVQKSLMFIMYVLGFLKCPGKTHFNFRKFHIGWLDSIQYDLANSSKNKIYTEIDSLGETSINLANGETIDCDVLICATGCDTFSRELVYCKDNKPLHISDRELLYRYSVIPDLPLIYFTGITPVSPYGPMNAYNRSAAIMKYLDIVSNEGVPNFAQLMQQEPQLFSPLINNLLFDTSGYVIAEYQNRATAVMFDLLPTKDGVKTIYDALFNVESTPYETAHRYIESKLTKSPK